MRIVVEQYPYQEAALKEALPGFEHLPMRNDQGQVRLGYVGYCFLPKVNDCVFFLPKVVLQGPAGNSAEDDVFTCDWVFGKYHPEDLLKSDTAITDVREKEFIYEFSVWIYRAVKEYHRLNPSSEIVARQFVSRLDTTDKMVESTFVDVLLSLVKFNEENRDYFLFTIKNRHSGYDKINWRKTIGTSRPLLQGKSPVYIDLVNKKKQIDFDEELLIIFFSILNYINTKYGFSTNINFNYDLIEGKLFEQYIEFKGMARLRQIKYKYYSDKALQLWHLCYAFFERSKNITSSGQMPEYLVARSFEIVFESIIDELIGEKNLPKTLKEQKDGKIIDHLYRYSDLVHSAGEREIYYIGDSKYYKMGNNVGDYSVYKQYTYAKNVIQYDFDLLFNGEKKSEDLMYLDPRTEGYNITPNFFISAALDSRNFSFNDDNLKQRLGENGEPLVHMNRQFANRLFDRDTLLVTHYDINFLFILALYGRSNEYSKSQFRNKAREKFRNEIIDALQKRYHFFLLEPREQYTTERALRIKFHTLLGKAYCPRSNGKFALLALEQSKEAEQENSRVIEEISTYFYIHADFNLNEDVDEFLLSKQIARRSVSNYTTQLDFSEMLMAAEPNAQYGLSTIEQIFNDSAVEASAGLSPLEIPAAKSLEEELALVGYYNGEKHLQQILRAKMYYVRIGARKGSLRIERDFDHCKYLLLHNASDFKLFNLTGQAPLIFTGEQLKIKGFTIRNPHESYLAYELKDGRPVVFNDIDVQQAIIRGFGNRTADSYFTTLKELFGI